MSTVKRDLDRVRLVYERRITSGSFSRYSLARPGERFMHRRRESVIRATLERAGLRELVAARILEIGCGRGQRLADLEHWGASSDNLFGVDLVPALVLEAARGYPRFHFAASSGHQLPFGPESFDMVMQFTVFTSLQSDALKQALAREMLRVLKPDGLILWYDLRYPSPMNRSVRPIGASEIRALFPGTRLQFRTSTLLPPLARALAPASAWLCRWLETIPVLRSHYLAIIRKAGQELN
jgi:SAM-dependent methyltransferase